MAPYRIAVLFEAVQLSDIIGIDLFGNCSTPYLATANTSFPVPPPILSQGLDIEFLYVSSSLEPARATPDVRIVPTHTYENCPRDVDALLIGGPLLSHRPEASLALMREVCEKGKGKEGVVIMTTCVGSMWLAASGVLKGRKATTNRFAIELAKGLHPDTEWEYKRWVVDKLEGGRGEVWTSGGAGCGIDMIATFIEERFPHPLSFYARMGLEFDPHILGQDYKETLEETIAKLSS